MKKEPIVIKDDRDRNNGCATYNRAKAVREISRKSSKIMTRAMELIHVDTNRPWEIPSLSTKSAGGKYRGLGD
jgi:hypothetical protein